MRFIIPCAAHLLLSVSGWAQSAALSLGSLADRTEAELRNNILTFWLEQVPHPEHGGFYGEVMNAGDPRPHAPRAALMTSRILWTFSAAYRQFGDERYRQMADRAFSDLTSAFMDREHGGVFWAITATGEPRATSKHVYGQAFAIYGLSEYYRATGEPAALDEAIALFRLIEHHARDRAQGGYFEAFSRQWQREPPETRAVVGPADAKSQNTHLHIMEAYASLLRVWPEPELWRAQRELIEILLTRIVDPATTHLGLFFNDDWTPRSHEISYGHDIEFAWLVTEAAVELGDAELLARVRPLAVRIAEVTLAEGVEEDGGIPYERSRTGVTRSRREWWVPAEAAVGFLNAYQISGDERFLHASIAQWEFIEKHLVDRVAGEWFHSVSATGNVARNAAKASAWKCPYHNGRACLELMNRARALLRD
jgi:cellobiose epimerase